MRFWNAFAVIYSALGAVILVLFHGNIVIAVWLTFATMLVSMAARYMWLSESVAASSPKTVVDLMTLAPSVDTWTGVPPLDSPWTKCTNPHLLARHDSGTVKCEWCGSAKPSEAMNCPHCYGPDTRNFWDRMGGSP